ncbi:MAG: HPP family protein [Thermoplasmatales archaeon]
MKEIELSSRTDESVSRLRDYFFYLVIFMAIISIISVRRSYVLAPPYAVSAYLIVFQRKTRYSKRWSIAFSYLFVILSSYAIHILLAQSLAGMLVNVVLISAFITFSGFAHPPAIALTIFSYIEGSITDFAISTLLALAILISSSLLIDFLRHLVITVNLPNKLIQLLNLQ